MSKFNRQQSSDEDIYNSENDYSNDVNSVTYDTDSSSNESRTSERFFKREGDLMNLMMVSNRQGADDEEKLGN